jgi:hypothetical protein
MKSLVVLFLGVTLLLFALSEVIIGEVPRQISYQGRLTDAVGAPVDATVSMTFTIYADSLGATSLWTETHPSVNVVAGIFQVRLGSITTLGQSVMDGNIRWLGVSVGVDAAKTLIPLVSTAYAYRANVTDTASLAKSVTDNSITSSKIANGTILFSDIAQNSATSGEVIKWNGSAWEAQADEEGSNTSGWTDGGKIVALTTSSDTVAINTSLRLGKLNIGGSVGIAAQSSIYFGTDSTFIKGFSGGDLTIQCEDHFIKTTGSTFIADVEDGNWVKFDGGNKRVGIGTTSVDDVLHLENSASLGDSYLKIQTSHSTEWGQAGIRIQTPANTWQLRQDNFVGSTLTAGALSLYSSGLGEEVMTWLENGNVGVGHKIPGLHKFYIRSNASGRSGSTLYAQNEHASGVAAYCLNNSSYPTIIAAQKGGGDFFRAESLDYMDIPTTVTRITNTGRVICSVLELTGGSDVAEPFEMADGQELPVGALVVIDEMNPGRLRLADMAYDTRVAGVVSGAGGVNPGITLTQKGVTEKGQNVAISGRVYCLADARYGPIRPGDLLTTSATSGHAMVASDRDKAYGTVIGKAMSSLESGQGLVLILVSLQ